MKRFGQMIRLTPEGSEKYIQYHAEVWPGITAMITACNIRNYVLSEAL